MKLQSVLELFYLWGWQVKDEYISDFEIFLGRAIQRGNVMMIFDDDDSVCAILVFFLTNNYKKLYKKGTFDIPNDDWDGYQIYIDKLVAREYTLGLRRKIQEVIEETFPLVMEGYYHRAPYDRCITIYKRVIKPREAVCLTK